MTSAPLPRNTAPLEALAEPRLAHAALEAVITVDHAQRIVMINPAGLDMFGLQREQALGMHLEQLIPVRLRAPHARFPEDDRAGCGVTARPRSDCDSDDQNHR